MFKITGLTALNVVAIRETIAGEHVVCTATTCTFHMPASEAANLVTDAIREYGGKRHPGASLHAVLRKIRKAESAENTPTDAGVLLDPAETRRRYLAPGAQVAPGTRDPIEGATVTVEPDTVVTDRSFQTASWWSKLALEPGVYEFKRNGSTDMYWATIPGTIIEDYFASSFAGANVQPYDRTKNAGKPGSYSVMRYGYQLREIPNVTLAPEMRVS